MKEREKRKTVIKMMEIGVEIIRIALCKDLKNSDEQRSDICLVDEEI